MDLRQLGYFVALFEEGSTTRAARRMNVVQPALSMQLSKLEGELGQKLFERTSHGMLPTPAGHTAYRLFAPILRDLSEAKQQLANRNAEVCGRISVGLLGSVTRSVLAKAHVVFSQHYPEVEITASEGYSSTLADNVRTGSLDFAFINRTQRKLDLPTIDIIDEEMIAATSSDRESPLGTVIALRDLTGLPLVLPSKLHGLRHTLDAVAEAEKVEFSVRLEVDTISAVDDIVHQSDFVTVLPAMAVNRGIARGRLRGHRIIKPKVTRRITCVHSHRRPLSPAAHMFIDILTAELSKLEYTSLPGASDAA